MFPLLYHAHNSLNPDDIDFWLHLAEERDGAILELGCGTGRVLTHLGQAGRPVYGLDRDFAMLKYFTEIAPLPLRNNVQIFQADFTQFHLGKQFDLIFLACNTYNTLEVDQRKEVLECARFHLGQHGLFAASMPNPANLLQLPRKSDLELEELFPHPVDGEPVQVSSAWKRTGNQIIFTWIYDHLLPDGSVERLQYDVTQHILPVVMVRQELQSAGLKVTGLYGDFDGSPFTEDSAYLILVSCRAENSPF